MQTNDKAALELLAQGKIELDLEQGTVLGRTTYRDNGYVNVRVTYEGKIKTFAVHRIVYLALNGFIPDGYVVDHINRVRDDNRPMNLRAIPRSMNTQKGNTDGNNGERNGGSKLTEKDVKRIVELRLQGWSFGRLEELYCVSNRTICDIFTKGAWGHVTSGYGDLREVNTEVAARVQEDNGRRVGLSNRRVGPEGTSWCWGCQRFREVKHFTVARHTWNGLDQLCKECKREKKRGYKQG